MSTILDMFRQLPSFFQGAFRGHLIIMIIGIVIFAISLVLTNKLATVCRYIFVIGTVIVSIYAFVTKKSELLFVSILALIVMIQIRVIIYSIRTIRQNRRDRRLEERALAKAASRRGSWKNRQGYSGEARAVVDDYVPEKMSRSEINDIVKNDMSDTPQAIKAKQATQKLPTAEELENARAILAAAEKAEKEKAARAAQAKSRQVSSQQSVKATAAAKETPANTSDRSENPAETSKPAGSASAVSEAPNTEAPQGTHPMLSGLLKTSGKASPAARKVYTVDDDPNPENSSDGMALSAKEKLNNLIHSALGSDEDEEDFFKDEEHTEKDLF